MNTGKIRRFILWMVALFFLWCMFYGLVDMVKCVKEEPKTYYEIDRDAVDRYKEVHKDDGNGYHGTRRNSWAEDQYLKSAGYDPVEYRKAHGYKYLY